MSTETISDTKPQDDVALKTHHSIVSPVFDFFMAGGVTFLFIPIMLLPFWDQGNNVELLYTASFLMLFVFNIPHFVHSYQLLYRNYAEKILDHQYSRASRIRHWIAGVIAPVLILLYLVFGALQSDHTMLGYAVNIMLFFTGWHYVKQGYGVMITLGVRKKAFFDETEKRILLINAYVAWIFSWLLLNQYIREGVFQQIPFSSIILPDVIMDIVTALFLCWSVAVFFFIIKRFEGHRVISINGMTAYLTSIYTWLIFSYSYPHIIIFVPALHSAQYILMVWKLEYERTKDRISDEFFQEEGSVISKNDVYKSMLPFLIVGFTLGAFAYALLPVTFEYFFEYDKEVFGSSLFLFMFLIFANIHHYFIDFAIWRKENPEMHYLFK